MERHTKTSFGSYYSLHFVNVIKCNKVACTLYLILCLYIIKNLAFILYIEGALCIFVLYRFNTTLLIFALLIIEFYIGY